MIQKMVQMIQILPITIPFINGIDLMVSRVKRRGKASEKLRHGQIRFKIPDINGGVQNPCLAILSAQDIADPQIPVPSTLGMPIAAASFRVVSP